MSEPREFLFVGGGQDGRRVRVISHAFILHAPVLKRIGLLRTTVEVETYHRMKLGQHELYVLAGLGYDDAVALLLNGYNRTWTK